MYILGHLNTTSFDLYYICALSLLQFTSLQNIPSMVQGFVVRTSLKAHCTTEMKPVKVELYDLCDCFGFHTKYHQSYYRNSRKAKCLLKKACL